MVKNKIKANKQTTTKNTKQKQQQHTITPALHGRWRYYQLIALNDQQTWPTSLAPLSP